MSKIIKEPAESTKVIYLRKTLIAVKKISEILEDIIEENLKNGLSDVESDMKDAFSCKKAPHINISNYLMRIIKYIRLEYTSLLLALIYIDKLIENNNFLLLLTCIVVSIKFNEDEYCSNTYYAKVGGISLAEFNKLEYIFVNLMDFKLFVDDDLFQNYDSYLDENSNVDNFCDKEDNDN